MPLSPVMISSIHLSEEQSNISGVDQNFTLTSPQKRISNSRDVTERAQLSTIICICSITKGDTSQMYALMFFPEAGSFFMLTITDI
ncbi:hypothetical protein ACHWQZ_G000107 [Mnemiopsis leidyi]